MKIKIINKSVHSLPQYETLGSAGLDLRANLEVDIELEMLDRTLIPTGLFLEIPVGYEAQIRPRSGMAIKHGLCVPNSPGTIDSDYRGEIKVAVINLSKEKIVVKNGDRVAQMVFAKHEYAEWIEVDILSESERGAGGFGSTGKQ